MPRIAANVHFMFSEHSYLDRFAAARAAGFAGVEIMGRDFSLPYSVPAEDVARAAKAAGIEVVATAIPPGNADLGEVGIAVIPGREGDFRRAVETARPYAETVGCGCVTLLVGMTPAGESPDRVAAVLAENLHHAGAVMAEAGIRVVVEAANSRDVPGFHLSCTADTVAAIEAAGHPNLAVHYDVYHMQIMEGDLIPTLEKLGGRLGHIQFADTPGRHEPGTGEINFPNVFAALDRIGYAGWASAEYVPRGRTEDGLDWFAPWRA